MALFPRAETVLAVVLFAQSALSLICYKTQPDTSIAASDCGNSLLLCASYLSGVATSLSYGCLGSSSCNPPLYNDLTCCSTSYCNAPTSTTSTSAPPIASNFPNGRSYIPYASTWAYLDSVSPSNWALPSFNDSAWLRSSAPFGFTSTGLADNMQTLLSVSNSGASYFRYTFSLDPAYFNALEKAEARVWFQDGVAIYLNGVVFNSFNMPSSVSFTTEASSIMNNTVITAPFLPAELTNSTNVIAVEIHQAAGSTAKFFDFELILVAATDNPYPYNDAVIRKGDTWLYSIVPPVSACDWSTSGLVSGSSCGTASANAPIGYNDSNLATQIQTSATTLYLSKSFNAPTIVAISYISISYDGGCVVYLSSLQGIVEAFRVNMPNGQVNYTTLAIADTPSSRRQTYYTFNLGSFVIPNTNYINIELHAFNQSNPHFSFDAELIVVSAATTCTPFDTDPTTSPINSYPYNYNYVQCVFPFLFNGKSYSSCTTITDGGRSGEPWCGLTSNVDVDNLWGYCNPCVSSCASGCTAPSINNEYQYSWCASSGGYCDIVSPTSSTPISTVTVTATPNPTSTITSSTQVGAIIGGVIGSLVGLFLLVLLVWFLVSRDWNKKKVNDSDYQKPIMPMDIRQGRTVSQISGVSQSRSSMIATNIDAQPDDIFIPFQSLRLGGILGQGHFGQVYQANYTGAQVAVKKSKGIDEKLLLEEATMMKNIPLHPNVLHYYGVSKDNGEFMVVTELCDKINLAQFLRNPENTLSPQQCRHLSKQIASGMWHISKRGIVHRDLRAENILLQMRGNELLAKVADFGLARSLNSRDDSNNSAYYRMAELKAIPIAWTPPEVLNPTDQFKYMAESDVWSFGIVMWEIYTRGSKPFDGVTVQVTIATIRDPIRTVPLLERPGNCPDDIFDIMNSCWAFDPQNRPTFEQLYNQL